MKFFRSNKPNLPELLRSSKQGFVFDADRTKARLMAAVDIRHLTKEDIQNLTFKPSHWPKYAFSLSLAAVLMVTTTGFAFASSQAAPGDILFPVQKLQNKVVLALPLPEAKKEEIRAEIVAKRLRELDNLNNDLSKSSKVHAAIDESERSMDEAISHLLPNLETEVESDLEPGSKDREEKNEKLNLLIIKLEDLSKQHEETLELIKKQTSDDELKEKINRSVTSLKSNREKLKKVRENRQKKESPNNSSDTESKARLKERISQPFEE